MRSSALFRACLAIVLALALSSQASAQDYPNRTIKLIVPTGAGGIADMLARLVGKSLSEQFGQPVIIDNRVTPMPESSRNRRQICKQEK